MPKILILENEELFKALKQVKDIPSEYEVNQLIDIKDLIINGETIVIGDVQNILQLDHANLHIIGLLNKDKTIKPKDILNNIPIIKKPYILSEIINVIQDIIARSKAGSEVVKIGEFEFDSATRILAKHGVVINLTEKESELVTLLNVANGEVVSRDEILKKVWGYEAGIETHTVETHIYRIRQKLGKDNDFIGNSGMGYFIKENPFCIIPFIGKFVDRTGK